MLIDAHAHIDMVTPEMQAAVLAQLADERIFTISVAMNPESYQRAQQIAANSPWVLPTFGIHPWEAAQWANRLDELDDLIAASPMLGEIGLDYHWVKDKTTYPLQGAVFDHFLRAAREQDKIVNLHTKSAEQVVLERLQEYQIRRAIVHWYSGPMTPFKALIEQGAYFTVGVEVLYSPKIQKIARRIPDHQLLTETDNPGGWEWFHPGEPGMPTVLNAVIEQLAVVRHTTPEAIISLVRANFLRLIGDDPGLASVANLLQTE
jgi:TatD DNase family protein